MVMSFQLVVDHYCVSEIPGSLEISNSVDFKLTWKVQGLNIHLIIHENCDPFMVTFATCIELSLHMDANLLNFHYRRNATCKQERGK